MNDLGAFCLFYFDLHVLLNVYFSSCMLFCPILGLFLFNLSPALSVEQGHNMNMNNGIDREPLITEIRIMGF